MNDLENLDFQKHVVALWKKHKLWTAAEIGKAVFSKPSSVLKILRMYIPEEEIKLRRQLRLEHKTTILIKRLTEAVIGEFNDETLLSPSNIAKKYRTTTGIVHSILEAECTAEELSTRNQQAQAKALQDHLQLSKKDRAALILRAKKTKDSDGYYLMPKPFWVTGRSNSEHIFVHQVVIMEALGISKMPEGFVVHHINENIHDNELTNLALMTMAAHRRQHKLTNTLRKQRWLAH